MRRLMTIEDDMVKWIKDAHITLFMQQIAKNLTFLSPEDKKKTFERLIEAEKKFLQILQQHPQSDRIYLKFIAYIINTNKNILSAMPYFRIRNTYFRRVVAKALKKTDIAKLKTVPINYKFMQFVQNNWEGEFPKELLELKETARICREEIVKNDLPLVVNRAYNFFSKTPQSHLTFMDLVQLAAEGILIGIDKYEGDYAKQFNSVLIGRMSANMIKEYNSTLLHFYPSDKNVIYSIQSIKARQNITDTNEAIKIYNQKRQKEGKKPLNEKDLLNLMNASSTVSEEMPNNHLINAYNKPVVNKSDIFSELPDVEEEIVKKNLYKKIIDIAKKECNILEKKILVMLGLIPYDVLFEK